MTQLQADDRSSVMSVDTPQAEGARAPRRRACWWPKLLLSLAALVLCAAVLEIGLRWLAPPSPAQEGLPGLDATILARWNPDGNSALHIASPNPRLVYELRPSANVFVRHFDHHVRTNAAGFRDREFQLEKPPGTTRIAVLGDSVAFGWNLHPEQRFTDKLQASFDAGGSAVEVYNFAIDGYNTLQEAEIARTKVMPYEPDLLLLAYVLNDDEIGYDSGLWYHFARSPSKAYDFLSLRLQRLWYRFRGGVDGAGLARLARLADEHGIPVVVVIFPMLEEAADGTYPHRAQHDRITRLAEGHGFLVLDLLPTLQSAGMAELRTNDKHPIHPDEQGHRHAADAIFRFLTEHAHYRQTKAAPGTAPPD